MANELIKGRDYTLIIDKSGSMGKRDCPGNKTRWQAVQESTLAVARKCEQYDPDGITLYLFAAGFRRYENVTSDKVEDVFSEHEPNGGTDLTAVLTDCFEQFLARKARREGTRPETVIVITDGEPDDQKSVMKTIIDTSRRLSRDEELAVLFLQIGRDAAAQHFLKLLDDQLTGAGAKFDIVDTMTFEELEKTPLNEVLLRAITD